MIALLPRSQEPFSFNTIAQENYNSKQSEMKDY